MGSGYSLKKSASGAPPSIHNQFGMHHSGNRGSQSAAQLANWDRPTTGAQGSAVAMEKLARPVCCIYVRNSDAVGGAGWVCTLPGIQTARIIAATCKVGRICERRGAGKCPQAKE